MNTIKQEMVRICKASFQQGLFSGTSGNLSFFDRREGILYITPSGLRYEDMQEEDLMGIDLSGNIRFGPHRPSSEWRMHGEVYKHFPDVNAVFHTHSPYATAFAVNRQSIPATLIEMHYFLGGSVDCAPYARPGTAEVGTLALPHLENKGGCLLANHGVLAIGKDLPEARIRAEYIEEAARIYALARSVGEPVILKDLG